ncbi:MAG: hypothetical protein IT161_21285 [Bryobacterales bacterium]|nr:hypothetical protein [Bryobacterales bacterium]
MSLNQAVNIDELPGQCERIGAELTAAARSMIRAAAPGLAGSGGLWREIPLLRRSAVRLHLHLGKQQDRVVLFFFKEKGMEDVLLDALVEFELRPVLEPEPAAPLAPGAVQTRMRVPRCFPLDVPEQEAQPLLNLLRAAREQVLFVAYERGVIAVHPKSREIAWPGSPNALKPADPAYVWPLLAIARSIGRWISGEDGPGAELMAGPRRLAADSDFNTIQQRLTEAWRRVVNVVERRDTVEPLMDGVEAWAQSLTPDYLVDSYRTELAMRLDGAGNVVFADSEDLFRLEAAIEYREEEDLPVARVDLRPPDFLLSGGVYRALLGELAGDKPVERISRELTPPAGTPWLLPPGSASPENVRAFIESAQGSGGAHAALVFRIKRGRRSAKSPDTDVFVLTGRLGEVAPVHIVLKAQVRVGRREDGELETEILDDGFAVLSCSHTPMLHRLDEVSDYFARLFGHLQRWFRVTATA